MVVKLKHLIFAALVTGLTAYLGISALADIMPDEGPSAYVRYYDRSGTVEAHVYWDDTFEGGPYNCSWADDVTADGGSLNWRPNMTKYGSGADTYVKLTMSKYKNYYFKIYNGPRSTFVRAFPADFANAVNPERNYTEYAHGNFSPDTAMCAGCHSTHTALKAQLLKQSTYYELCLLCHGNSSTQSKYDVEMGKVFTGTEWVDSLGGPVGTGVVTSAHSVDDRGAVDTAVYGSDPNQILTFTCVSCHNGHGGKNDNYRLLKKTVYPANNSWNPQTVRFTAYAIVKDPAVGEEVYLVSGNTEFCAACHLDYDDGNAYVAGGVYSTYLRHPVTVGETVYSVHTRGFSPTSGDNLPLQYYVYGESGTGDKRTAVVCQTCHYAHGTYKSFVITGSFNGTETVNQKMLRLDNYGVCQSCHKK